MLLAGGFIIGYPFHMPSLKKLIGQDIVTSILFLKPELQVVKLHNIEASGIWIESQFLTNYFLNALGQQSAPKTAVFFVPFSQIEYVMSTVDYPALSEKVFGVLEP